MVGRFAKLSIETVEDLLMHFPSRYEDYSEAMLIADAMPDEKATFAGEIVSIESKHTWKKRLLVTEAKLRDDSGDITLVWFNQKYILDSLREGSRIRVSGKVTLGSNGFTISSPAFENASRDAVHTGKRVPMYPETYGLSSKYLRFHIASLFKYGFDSADPVPSDILDRLHLPTKQRAWRAIHSPRSDNELLVARKRFAFDEMLLVQLKVLQVKRLWDRKTAATFPFDAEKTAAFLETLPFTLTAAQAKASREIAADLASGKPMNRLLNGDVGSGKTVVAALAALHVASPGSQTVVLTPTEVLAKQHFDTFSTLFRKQPFETALFTQAYRYIGDDRVSRETMLQSVRSGIARVVIATHTVLQESVRFHRLGLVIVDEQHRFGVAQRARLQQASAALDDGSEKTIPHFLTMTATPIPRTLTLAFFGHLSLSLLDELPEHRKPIVTRVAASNADRAYVYDFIRKQIKEGRQAFVILPFVETSETEGLSEVKAAVAEHARLSKEIFPDLRLGLLHGKLKAKEKESVMAHFKDKQLEILVATSVVEVGIDIPNASVMIIEDADRFGLSQLHQFRGRVGRGEHQSFCFLFPGESASVSNKRLQAMVTCKNGFDLAERDLKLRGPGSLFGTRQSGLPDIAMENIANLKLIEIAQQEAEALLTPDPTLARHPFLREALARFDAKLHLE
jgi:ATP-dependent DNA helicase RecG